MRTYYQRKLDINENISNLFFPGLFKFILYLIVDQVFVYYSCSAIKDDSPFSRIKTIVKWYLSGFYKKPKGLKKPYNPIIGEKFRCYWKHPNGSKTFFIAEQVEILFDN